MYPGVAKYRLGPFLLASEIPLPELEPLAADATSTSFSNDEAGPGAVSIRLADVPQHISGVIANESRWWASRQEYLLHVPQVANFLVRNGREVLVQPAPGALPADIRAYLLAPIFSTLCHQAGMYSLHASAVRVGAGVVAFLGDSGAGKSTLAAGLAQRGFTILADDICLLDARPNDHSDVKDCHSGPELAEGEESPHFVRSPTLQPIRDDVLVIPVAPALKLWRSALERLGASPESLPRVFSSDDKFRVKIPQPHDPPQHLPLREVLFLEWADESDANQDRAGQPASQTTFTQVEGVHAVTRLMEFTHYDYLMKPAGRQTGNFLLCGRIVSQARAFALRRPRSLAHLSLTLDALELHLAALKE
jgi:hypothetical protein